jgi:hypothetical protein
MNVPVYGACKTTSLGLPLATAVVTGGCEANVLSVVPGA